MEAVVRVTWDHEPRNVDSLAFLAGKSKETDSL